MFFQLCCDAPPVVDTKIAEELGEQLSKECKDNDVLLGCVRFTYYQLWIR
jgi:hypothetical protein